MHLFLIGYRATGKSTVAKELGQLLDLPVIDLDQTIVDDAGKTIAQIFAESGEAKFRELERLALTKSVESPPSVISLGGGTVLAISNRDLIRDHGKAVWLNASNDVIIRRLEGDMATSDNRPSLTRQGLVEEIETVMTERRPVYAACADYSVDTNPLSAREVAEQIAKWWRNVDNKK